MNIKLHVHIYEMWLESFNTGLAIFKLHCDESCSDESVPFWLNTPTTTMFPLLKVFPEIFFLNSVKNLFRICLDVFNSQIIKSNK